MRRVLLALAAVAFLAGCGTTHHANPNTPLKVILSTGKPGLRFKEPNGTTCVTRTPPQASECIEQAHARSLAAPTLTSHQECADWSQWQGWYPDTSGLHCVIIQAAYGLSQEPSLREQVRDARNHGLPYGVYNFGEPGVSGASEMAYTHALEPHAPLGYWFDVEVSGVFWRSCEFTSEAQDLGLRIFGVFSYPGGYVAGGGQQCAGYLWASEWGIGGPSPFGGYPASAIKLWQDCGTCDRFGVTTDLDVDEGLLALASPPKPKPKPKPPTPAQLRRELQGDLRLRTTLRALEAKHKCRNPPERRPVPDTAAYRHACYGVWAPKGRKVDTQVVRLERELR
jgi:hypothetical protein